MDEKRNHVSLMVVYALTMNASIKFTEFFSNFGAIRRRGLLDNAIVECSQSSLGFLGKKVCTDSEI